MEDELEKCLESTRKLKTAVLQQQKVVILQLKKFGREKQPKRVCPFCECVFDDHIEYEVFEQHVIEHLLLVKQ